MHKGQKGMGGHEPAPRDAVDWFVSNEADRNPGGPLYSRWQEWSADGGNRKEFAHVLELQQDLLKLRPPSVACRADLPRDVRLELTAIVEGPKADS